MDNETYVKSLNYFVNFVNKYIISNSFTFNKRLINYVTYNINFVILINKLFIT